MQILFAFIVSCTTQAATLAQPRSSIWCSFIVLNIQRLSHAINHLHIINIILIKCWPLACVCVCLSVIWHEIYFQVISSFHYTHNYFKMVSYTGRNVQFLGKRETLFPHSTLKAIDREGHRFDIIMSSLRVLGLYPKSELVESSFRDPCVESNSLSKHCRLLFICSL